MYIGTYTNIFIFTYFNITRQQHSLYYLKRMILKVQTGGYGTFQWIGMIVAREKKSQAVFSACSFPQAGWC